MLMIVVLADDFLVGVSLQSQRSVILEGGGIAAGDSCPADPKPRGVGSSKCSSEDLWL